MQTLLKMLKESCHPSELGVEHMAQLTNVLRSEDSNLRQKAASVLKKWLVARDGDGAMLQSQFEDLLTSDHKAQVETMKVLAGSGKDERAPHLTAIVRRLNGGFEMCEAAMRVLLACSVEERKPYLSAISMLLDGQQPRLRCAGMLGVCLSSATHACKTHGFDLPPSYRYRVHGSSDS